MLRYVTPSRRRAVSVVFVLVTLILVLTLRTLYLSEAQIQIQYSLPFGLGKVDLDRPGLLSAPTCAPGLGHLRQHQHQYGLTPEIIYQQHRIRPVVDETLDRDAVASINEPLLGNGQAVRLDKSCKGWDESQTDTIDLKVPALYPKRNHSDLLFGVATSFDRLRESLPQFDVWLADSGARLLAIITDAEKHEHSLGKMVTKYHNHGIELVPIKPTNKALGPNEQHFTIIRDMLQHATPETKWGVIIDDDTLFPSLYPVAKMLEERDHTRAAYVGGLSENEAAINFHGYMAYGGAGVFLSMPLVRQLEPHIEACLDEVSVREGDGLLKYCIYNKTEARLDDVPDLHQLDMRGDMSGFYESGELPLSVHHWKTWHSAPMADMAAISRVCDSCFLQRWAFGNDTVLANGYSIAVYEQGLADVDLAAIEGTWNDAPAFAWSMGPLREKLPEDRKKSYRLVRSEKTTGGLRQIYVHSAEKRPEADKETEELVIGDVDRRDEVVELLWEW